MKHPAKAANESGAAGFSVRLRVDFSEANREEALYEAGPVRLVLRLAGRTPGLEKYDEQSGNYLNFPLDGGVCPVVEATICERGGRVGIPLGALARADGTHEVTLDFSPPHWRMSVDGLFDEDMPPGPDSIAWPDESIRGKPLSPRVKSAEFFSPALVGAIPAAPDARRIGRSIQ